MTFSTDLKSHLQADPAVSVIVDDRITPSKLQDLSAMPAAVYSFVYGETQNSLDGFTSGRVIYRVQIDCWALTYRQAELLALAIRDRMNAAPAMFTSSSVGFPSFVEYEDETKRHRWVLEFICGHRES